MLCRSLWHQRVLALLADHRRRSQAIPPAPQISASTPRGHLAVTLRAARTLRGHIARSERRGAFRSTSGILVGERLPRRGGRHLTRALARTRDNAKCRDGSDGAHTPAAGYDRCCDASASSVFPLRSPSPAGVPSRDRRFPRLEPSSPSSAALSARSDRSARFPRTVAEIVVLTQGSSAACF